VKVVFVCTGNRFRSPIAEALFRAAVADDIPVDVSSVGTLNLDRVPVLPEAYDEADRLGVDVSRHRARPLSLQDLATADLVLGFERMHVVAAVVDAKARRDRTFTLPEAVQVVEAMEPPPALVGLDRAEWILEAMASRRGRDPGLEPPPELADPIGGSRAIFRQTADQIDDLVRRLARGLLGQPRRRAS
jgi:protein-tyrosine phosphatase